ncbi:hypothetical protein F5Y14DRAFT_432377 [Nemania sp. NC0429]|nr:hypothetical protein F5Y14DRAFT_432377 [Nemania sp. NC0429]
MPILISMLILVLTGTWVWMLMLARRIHVRNRHIHIPHYWSFVIGKWDFSFPQVWSWFLEFMTNYLTYLTYLSTPM